MRNHRERIMRLICFRGDVLCGSCGWGCVMAKNSKMCFDCIIEYNWRLGNTNIFIANELGKGRVEEYQY